MKFSSITVAYAAVLFALSDVVIADTKVKAKDSILKEDSKYWNRFLAVDYSIPPPKPPKCLIDVSGID